MSKSTLVIADCPKLWGGNNAEINIEEQSRKRPYTPVYVCVCCHIKK